MVRLCQPGHAHRRLLSVVPAQLFVALFQAWHAHDRFPVKHILLAYGRLRRLALLCVLSGQSLSSTALPIFSNFVFNAPQRLLECTVSFKVGPLKASYPLSALNFKFGLACIATGWRPTESWFASSCCDHPPISSRSVGVAEAV